MTKKVTINASPEQIRTAAKFIESQIENELFGLYVSSKPRPDTHQLSTKPVEKPEGTVWVICPMCFGDEFNPPCPRCKGLGGWQEQAN